MQKRLRVVVADDSSTYRRLVREVLVEIPYIDLVGVASNGVEALEAARTKQPDLLTLDIEMPFLSGLDVLREMRSERLDCGAIVLSAVSVQAAAATNQALRLGAFDFIVKPVAESPKQSRDRLREALESRLFAFARARFGDEWVRGRRGESTPSQPAVAPTPLQVPTSSVTPRVIAIGVSTGGPAALTQLLPQLPADLGAPILIVQHMPPLFTRSLADDLDRRCKIEVREAENGDILRPNVAYIAPGGKQMKLVSRGPRPTIAITEDPPERNCRPSVDYLFRSVAETYRGAALALVMTGMGDDGAAGCRQLKEQGATVVAQDEHTSVVFGMPRRVIEMNLADEVLPLEQLAERIEVSLSTQPQEAAAT